MIHPDTELRFINDRIGFGVAARRFIPRGTITWVLDDLDQALPPRRVAGLSEMQQRFIAKYGYLDGQGRTIVCWDHARFVNHSCAPTCLAPGYAFEIAVRDIRPGEELTDDYGALNVDDAFRCLCGAARCRGVIGPADFERQANHWDRLLAEAFPLIGSVEQPLWELVREPREVRAALEGRATVRSCRVHHYPTPQRRAAMQPPHPAARVPAAARAAG